MRQEFPAKVKVQAYERAKGKCEDCKATLRPGHVRYDHWQPDALGGAPTLANCRVRCDICDAPKTAADQTQIAKMKRQHAKHIGALRRRWHSKWKRRVDGTTVLRNSQGETS